MSFDVWSELIDVRERLAVMETTLLDIRRAMDKQPTTNGSIVVPVAVITCIIQGGIALITKFM